MTTITPECWTTGPTVTIEHDGYGLVRVTIQGPFAGPRWDSIGTVSTRTGRQFADALARAAAEADAHPLDRWAPSHLMVDAWTDHDGTHAGISFRAGAIDDPDRHACTLHVDPDTAARAAQKLTRQMDAMQWPALADFTPQEAAR